MCFHIFSGYIQNNPVGCIHSSSRQSSAHVASLCPTDASLMWGLRAVPHFIVSLGPPQLTATKALDLHGAGTVTLEAI
jgi:hypothetical protein